jgi:hypothetical protein
MAYAFAAFAKLNTGFLDPAVSCAAHYASEVAVSWGLPAIDAPVLRSAAIASTLAAELAVPLLLALRRTRTVGVALGIVFHGLIALNLRQHFWDFSSVLLALFLLFAPAGFAERVLAALSTRVRLAVAVIGLLLLVAVAVPPSGVSVALVFSIAHVSWCAVLGALLILLWRHTRAHGWCAATRLPAWPGRVWLVAPLVVALNGLTPYLEIKTVFGFQMYANLRTDRGVTNHLLVPATWPLTAIHDGLVTIRATDDPKLKTYVGSGYVVPWEEFRAYLQQRPDTAVTFERYGVVHEVRRAGDDPRLMHPVSEVRRRVLAARAVDLADPPRCQTAWGPAR